MIGNSPQRNMMDRDMGLAVSPVQEKVEDRLERTRKQLMDEVEAIDNALAILKEQPKLLETLNLLRRVGL